MKLIQSGLKGRHPDLVEIYQPGLHDFVIIEIAKLDAANLSMVLHLHPDVFIARPKNVKFFDRYFEKDWSFILQFALYFEVVNKILFGLR